MRRMVMPDPTVVYGVGATKAGTSWLYRYLHDHPDCAMPAVKEAHYWDTFDPEACAKQVAAFRVRLRELRDMKLAASEAGQGWKVKNLDRRINEMKALMEEDGFSEIEIRIDIFVKFRMLKASWAG